MDNLKKSDTWKIQLTMANNFISSIDNNEKPLIHPKNDGTEIMINDEANEIMKEHFIAPKNRYQIIWNQ